MRTIFNIKLTWVLFKELFLIILQVALSISGVAVDALYQRFGIYFSVFFAIILMVYLGWPFLGRRRYCLLTEAVDIIRDRCAKKNVNPAYLYGDDIAVLNGQIDRPLVDRLMSEPVEDIYFYIIRECQKGTIVLYGEEMRSTCILPINQRSVNFNRFSGDFNSLLNCRNSEVLYQKLYLSKLSIIKLYFVVTKKIRSLKRENNPFLNFYVD
jgi:hypothetical protein